ncbi:MAG TPA: hypothetical protein VGM17_04330 [Rhizomicrobium sp.]|jgi:hypothetical protein
MDFFSKFGLPAKLNTALLLLTVALLFVITVWLDVPPTPTLFFGAGILFVLLALTITGVISMFAHKPPKKAPGANADDG